MLRENDHATGSDRKMSIKVPIENGKRILDCGGFLLQKLGKGFLEDMTATDAYVFWVDVRGELRMTISGTREQLKEVKISDFFKYRLCIRNMNFRYFLRKEKKELERRSKTKRSCRLTIRTSTTFGRSRSSWISSTTGRPSTSTVQRRNSWRPRSTRFPSLGI